MKQIQEIKDYIYDIISALDEVNSLVLQLEQDLQKVEPTPPATGLRARLQAKKSILPTDSTINEVFQGPYHQSVPTLNPQVRILEGVNLGGGIAVEEGMTNDNKGNREYVPPGTIFKRSPLELAAEEEMKKVEAQERMKGKR